MVVNGIPKTERIWVKRISSRGDIYYITSKDVRDYYFLYKEENGKAIKLGKAKSPLDLERKYIGEWYNNGWCNENSHNSFSNKTKSFRARM